jgi:tetratricopeptide (TPR) repeat protein
VAIVTRTRAERTGWALALALILTAGAGGEAQTRITAGPVVHPILDEGAGRTPEAQTNLRQAQDWLRLHMPDRAIALLEPLHRDLPDDALIDLTLADAYQAGGRFLDAAALYRKQAELRGDEDPGLWIRLARAHQLAGQGGVAVEALLECVRRQPGYASMLLDAFQLLAADSLVGREARETLEKAARAPDSPPAWTEIVAQGEAAGGEGAKALALTMTLERRKGSGGKRLIELAQALVRGGQPEVALAALDSARALPARGDLAEEAIYDKGRLLERMRRPGPAAAAYAEGETRFPDGATTLRGSLARARLLLAEMNDPAGARAAYGRVLGLAERRARGDLRALRDEARLGIAECDLRAGEFARADSAYATIAEQGSSGVVRERAAYQRAEILFYQAHFPEAEEAYYALTDQYPDGDWANDALGRALLLGENSANPPALAPLARALYQVRAGKTAEALAVCRQGIAQFDSTTAGAELRRVEITLLADEGSWAQADSALAGLRATHPTSRAVPAALLCMAERSESDPARRVAARAYYETLVLQCPNSFEARRARDWLAGKRAAGEAS